MKSIEKLKIDWSIQEIAPRAEQIRYTYCLVLARDPAQTDDPINPDGDFSGVYHWQDRMTDTKLSKEEAIRKMINSKEFKDKWLGQGSNPGPTTKQFVEAFYQALFQRGVAQGDTWWEDQIDKKYIAKSVPCPPDKYPTDGLRNDVVNRFCAYANAIEAQFSSDEFKQVQFDSHGNPKNEFIKNEGKSEFDKSIELFFIHLLGRVFAESKRPHSDGEVLLGGNKVLDGDVGMYNSQIGKHYGLPPLLNIAQILKSHYVSPEGIQRLGSLTKYDLETIPVDILVTDMYNRFYKRNPDPSGQANWVDEFNKQGLDPQSRLNKWPGIIERFIKSKELLDSHPQLKTPEAYNW